MNAKFCRYGFTSTPSTPARRRENAAQLNALKNCGAYGLSGFPDKMRRRDTAAPELIEFCTSQVAVQLAYGAFIFKNTFNAWNPSVFIEINAAACEGLLLCSVIQLRQPDKDRVIVLVGRQTIQGLMPEHILPPMR